MRDRLPKTEGASSAQSASKPDQLSIKSNPEEEAVNALLALGYKPTEASKMVSRQANQDLSVEAMIRNALKESLS